MSTRRLVLTVLGVLCLVTSLGVATAAPTARSADVGSDAVAAQDGTVPQADVPADAISLRATLRADGSAAWRVTYRIELDDENATAAFEELRGDVESGSGPYLERFRDRMVRTANAAENATGREMAIRNVSVSASRESLPQGEYGVVTYRLDWAGFAAVADDRLRAGDAIDRLFLDERTSLTVAWPEAYALESIQPEATSGGDGSVTWQGRRDFGPGEPRVVLAPSGDDEGVDRGGDQIDGSGLAVVVVGLLVVLSVALGLWWIRWRDAADGADTTGPEGGDRPPTGGDTGGRAAGGSGPPDELLSNEERVLRLLERRGGRIKQQQVAGELEWTDAKTSQVVSDLRENGEIESFRLGRENVLTLPDVSIEPDAEEDREK